MEAALAELLPLAESATGAGAEILFLPEYCGGLASDGVRLRPPAQPEESHPVLSALREFAAARQVWINIGSIAIERSAGSDENDKIVNRGYMLDDNGEIVGHYDKIHLFDVDLAKRAVYRESDTVAPGDIARLYDTPFGRIGHTICYDLRFPQLFRDLAQAGAEIICCPAAFTRMTGEAHWHVLNRARAIENTCFMVSPCAIGPIDGGGESYGHSLIVSPWGDVLADGGETAGTVHAQLDLGHADQAASRIPSLRHDRHYRLDEPGVQSQGSVA